MKCHTPEISWHNRDPIFSVDIQSKTLPLSSPSPTSSLCYRIATCGNDTHVIIWKASLRTDARAPSIECVADLTQHQRSVNCVRFAPNGSDLLAAGDDDNVIIIWKLDNDNDEPMQIDNAIDVPNDTSNICNVNDDPMTEKMHVPNQLFDSDTIAKEQWKPYKVLRGHIQDVCDLSWSSDGQMLVSGSIDNSSIVWDVNKGQKLHIFNKYKGFVQGVSFDPLHKYIATVSADRSLRIFNFNNKKQLKLKYVIQRIQYDNGERLKSSRLFYDDTLRSFCRRLTFTPGGELLIVPSGILETSDHNEDGKCLKSEDNHKDKDNGDDKDKDEKRDNENGSEKWTKIKNKKDEDGDDDDDGVKYINTSYIFDRKLMNKPLMYLPSDKYTVAVRCCPQLFQLRDDFENQFPFPYRIVWAVATQDSVLFYDSQQSCPFAQVKQIHYLRLTDISWSPDGRMLIITSTDGFATFVVFDSDEIGTPYNGPKYQFEESMETESPQNKSKTPKVEVPPEVDRQSAKLPNVKITTPSIKTFFRPKVDVNPKSIGKSTDECTNDRQKNEIKTPDNSTICSGQSSTGVKRKEEVIDLTEDSVESSGIMKNKRLNMNLTPQKQSDNSQSLDTAEMSLLIAPANYRVRDNNSLRKVTAEFNDVSQDQSNNSACKMDSDVEMNDERRVSECVNVDHSVGLTKSNDIGMDNNKLALSFSKDSNAVINQNVAANSMPKHPRRIQLITLKK